MSVTYKDIKSDIESLEKDLENFELSNTKDDFNFFTITGIDSFEIRHSKFLSWLFNPKSSHGLKDIFIKEILKSMHLDELSRLDYKEADVFTEYNRIDIFIVSKQANTAIAIENKYHSGEHDEQLQRYRSFVEKEYKNYNKIYLYLTLYGDLPSDDKWKSLSYTDVYNVLKKDDVKLIYENNTKLLSFINDYLSVLQKELNMNKKEIEMCDEIYRKHKKAFDFIMDNKSDPYNIISNYIDNKLNDLEKEGKIIRLDSNRSYIRFTTKELREAVGQFGDGTWLSSNDVIACEFCILRAKQYQSISIWCALGPGEKTKKDNLYDKLSQSKDFKPWYKNSDRAYNNFSNKVILDLKEHMFEESDLDVIGKAVDEYISNTLSSLSIYLKAV